MPLFSIPLINQAPLPQKHKNVGFLPFGAKRLSRKLSRHKNPLPKVTPNLYIYISPSLMFSYCIIPITIPNPIAYAYASHVTPQYHLYNRISTDTLIQKFNSLTSQNDLPSQFHIFCIITMLIFTILYHTVIPRFIYFFIYVLLIYVPIFLNALLYIRIQNLMHILHLTYSNLIYVLYKFA